MYFIQKSKAILQSMFSYFWNHTAPKTTYIQPVPWDSQEKYGVPETKNETLHSQENYEVLKNKKNQ